MDDRTLRILEFDKIVKILSGLTSSSLGRELAEEIVPQTEYRKVAEGLKETSDGSAYIARRGSPPMGGIHDIRGSLKRVDVGAVLSPGELLRIADTLRAVRNLKNYSSEGTISDEGNTVSELIRCLQGNRRIEDKITLSILNEEEIADSASGTLSTIRRQIRSEQDSIRDKLNEIIKSSKYQKYMQDAIVTMRGDRYVVPVKQEFRNEVPGLMHDSSASGSTIFIEPMSVVEANNKIKQLRIKEQLEIDRILQELTANVAEILEDLQANVSILAKLDLIFAKGRLSLDYNCVCPKLNDSRKIVIKRGRHPLLDKKTVVPTDFWIGDEFKTLVITGPNTGGKTVTLKTVGLFTLMAQAGLHIPAADGTEICIFEKVFADIGDEQSIEQSLSTFSSHMRNIVRILQEAGESSLVLFDELGAGTDPTEGAALAMSILECLHQMGAIAVATTHYSELKVYALSTKGVENACCEFDVETLKPTYKLLIGVPGKSNAFAISRRLGLTDDVLDRAKEFLTQEDIEFEDVLLSIEKNRSETERDRTAAKVLRTEVETLKRELEEQKRRFETQKEKLTREAREEAKKIIQQAKLESEELLEQMRRIQQENERSERERAAEEIRLKLKSKINSLEESLAESVMPKKGYVKPPENLKPGDSVLIVNLNQKGVVVTPPGKDGEAVIQAGIMKINVHITNLKLINEQTQEVHRTGAGRIGSSKSGHISLEVDLRGMNLDDATETVDKYLDDASIAGLNEVMVIHGKGTGVLRSGIHQFLKRHHHVKSFRLGKYGEGESGVTVVELK